ncbi:MULTISPECIES: tyrosine-type recombinase/integrase [Comamonas]|uniref:tyrosine-type recombinase/integrase n=1 Tax=Comamonas TaxID=283 RepID=UPI0006B9CE7E|nr:MULTISPECIES: tyrosine-type recombinase/integrase [Comamonas]QOQ84223.1 tyrosine-type recombinase/integrase [Comamonas thiooxydans]
MGENFQKVIDRKALAPRRDPYWMKLSQGNYLGYRKMDHDSDVTWTARSRDPITEKQHRQTLGDFSEFPPSERFDLAKKAAEEWFAHIGKGGVIGTYTVASACDAYVDHLISRGKESSAADAKTRFASYVLDDSQFANVELTKLTPAHLEAWRRRLRDRPVTSGKNKGQKRSDSTLNRDMTPLRAALNHAYGDGHVTSDFAWKKKLLPVENADTQRKLYLDIAQRRRLIEHAPADLSNFLKGLSLLPLRPGTLAKICVCDFSARLRTLSLPMDKGQERRQIQLSKQAFELCLEQAQNAEPSAPLFRQQTQAAWHKDAWKDRIKLAASQAGLPKETVTYTLRHSTITDLVHQGVDLLTVAQISGTSVKMIEKHYGHLRNEVSSQALEKLSL